MTGEVTEQPLGDGTAEVKVTLRTRNALAWATADCSGQDSNLIFGHKAGEVLNGSAPSVIDSFLEASFINPANSQLPDILEFVSGARPDTLSLYFHASGKGALRPASDFPAGTRGKLRVDQICSAGGGTFTCPTAEVEVKAQGK
ncbi:MAG TPA: hypothetical protein VGQ71_04670 [Terriglobales bacterium]|jgi:hypothetical protein|nr:hypothetical protein [Terriglobales bacterium]